MPVAAPLKVFAAEHGLHTPYSYVRVKMTPARVVLGVTAIRVILSSNPPTGALG